MHRWMRMTQKTQKRHNIDGERRTRKWKLSQYLGSESAKVSTRTLGSGTTCRNGHKTPHLDGSADADGKRTQRGSSASPVAEPLSPSIPYRQTSGVSRDINPDYERLTRERKLAYDVQLKSPSRISRFPLGTAGHNGNQSPNSDVLQFTGGSRPPMQGH